MQQAVDPRRGTGRKAERPLLRLDVAGAEIPSDLGEVTGAEYRTAVSYAISQADAFRVRHGLDEEREELLSEALIAVHIACGQFRRAVGVKFVSYAVPAIHNRLKNYLRSLRPFGTRTSVPLMEAA